MIVLATRALCGQDQRATEWNRQSAAAYLDERMDLWFARAKKLETGEGETSCVSCHTTIPYMLARSSLRRAMGVNRPTPHETRILDEVARRVDTYDSHQPLYDFSDDKKTESRGTEAVLNTLILAIADSELPRDTPSEPAAKALRHLWETQRPDGSWDWLDFGLEPFETTTAGYYGATLAALAVGRSPETKDSAALAGMGKLRAYLNDNYGNQNAFNRTWFLLASTRWKGLIGSETRTELIADLERRQRDDGGWSLESIGAWKWSKTEAPFQAPGKPDSALLERSDGYATGLIVYALRESGVSIDRSSLKRGIQWLRANQREVQLTQGTHLAWRSHSLNFDREHGGDKGEPWRRMFMSDSATSFAALALIAHE
jgi:hypothetical protein